MDLRFVPYCQMLFTVPTTFCFAVQNEFESWFALKMAQNSTSLYLFSSDNQLLVLATLSGGQLYYY